MLPLQSGSKACLFYDDRTNSDESNSILRQGSRGNIIYSACFVCEKDKLHYSKYCSTRRRRGSTSLKRAMMDNLKSDHSSLVVTVTSLKIIISVKDAHSADVVYHQRCYNKFTRDYKPAENNRKDEDSVEKATAEKKFLTLLVINQSCSLPRHLVVEINCMKSMVVK